MTDDRDMLARKLVLAARKRRMSLDTFIEYLFGTERVVGICTNYDCTCELTHVDPCETGEWCPRCHTPSVMSALVIAGI